MEIEKISFPKEEIKSIVVMILDLHYRMTKNENENKDFDDELLRTIKTLNDGLEMLIKPKIILTSEDSESWLDKIKGKSEKN